MGTINLTPTPTGYALTLLRVIKGSTSASDRAWAEGEIINAFKVAARQNPEQWGQESA